MTGKGGDYEGWILRLIEKPEDIIHSFSELSWLKFAADQIEKASGQGITKGQIASLADYRHLAYELPEQLGFGIQEVTRYRDASGRWSKEPTDRPTKVVAIRGEGERFISKVKANIALQAEIDARGVRKKPKT